MTFSRFFFNSSILRQNLRQHGWVGILYTLVLLFILPLQMFMNGDPLAKPAPVDNLFNLGVDSSPFLIAFPVGAGLLLFRYLQSKMSSDHWHVLPLRRSQLLASHTVSGLILLLPPVWITAVVTAVIRPLEGNAYIYQGADVWEWCLTASLLTLFLFVFSIFVAICTGQTLLQGILIFILLVLPAALLQFINMHLDRYLYGYPGWYGLQDILNIWAPLLRIMDLTYKPLTNTEMWGYAILSVVFTAVSFMLYRKRHSETAGQALAFTYFNPLFKAGVMLCSMLLASSYFSEVKNQPGWVIGGAFAGGLIGYIISEMVLRKTWHIMNRKLPIEFALYAVLLGLLIYVPVSGLTGYENRVPQQNKVAAVYAGGNYREMTENQQGDTTRKEREEGLLSTDRQYIGAVTALHQAVVNVKPDQQETPQYDYTGSRQFTLVYKLINGRKLMRTYNVPAAGFEPELKGVMEKADFKREKYHLSQLEQEVESFRLSYLNKVTSISEPQDVEEFNEILKRELLNRSYEDQVSDQRGRGSIDVVSKPKSAGQQIVYSYEWYPSYREMTAWLEEKGYADKIRYTAKDVLSVEMFRNEHQGGIPVDQPYDLETRLQSARKEKRSVSVTDPALINSILERQRAFTQREAEYLVKIEYKGGMVNYVSLSEQDAGPALKALFPQRHR